ncbi:Outer membrane porin protein [Paraburkholderia rhynchosiae]|uniref:Porin n=1 Tax=Paraburkholderia rhynchosiae TaxID=487049 RepID=A0A2N7WDT5_9BURK|nr:porin [Paraburkholderia rhynchosiae]CAB3723468.1 Outer membrane porin protein [Paraburkholderia rhynchosiae]
MRKLIVGCAVVVTLLPCGAHAQNSVTLYGVVDVFMGYFRNSQGQSVVSMNSGGMGGSRWGLRVKEDLGGGLDAIAVLESGFNVNNGTSGQGGRLFGRQAYIGIQSNQYGSVIAGRLQTIGYYWAAPFDPLLMASGSVLAMIGENNRPWMFNLLQDPARQDNTIQYTAPAWRGVNAAASYSWGNNQGLQNATHYELASVSYENGPIYGSYGFGHSLQPSAVIARNTYEHSFGLKYDLKWLSLTGTYQIRLNNPGRTDHAWQVGFSVPTGVRGAFHASYGGQSDENTVYGAGQTTPNGNWNTRSWAIGYTYSVSKSTTIYSFFKKLQNNGVARQSIFPPGGLPLPTANNVNVSAFGLGLATRF